MNVASIGGWIRAHKLATCLIVGGVVVVGAGAAFGTVTIQHSITAQQQAEAKAKHDLTVARDALSTVQGAGSSLQLEASKIDAASGTGSPADQITALKAADAALVEALANSHKRGTSPAGVKALAAKISTASNKVGVALKDVGKAIDTSTQTAIAAATLADPGTRQAVTDQQAALDRAIAAQSKVQTAIDALNTAIAAMNASQAQAVAAAAAAAAAPPPAGASKSSSGSSGSRSSGGGSAGGGSTGGESTGGGTTGGEGTTPPPPVDHTPHVTLGGPGAYSPGCAGSYAYQQTTSSGGGIIIDVAYTYTYTTFSTATGWGLQVFNCTP